MDVACVQVHDATSKLTAIPSSPEDFAELLGFLQKLEERRHGLDETYDHVGFPVADSSSFALLLDLMSTQSLTSTKGGETKVANLETLPLMGVDSLHQPCNCTSGSLQFIRVPTSLRSSQTSLVSAQQCDACSKIHLVVQHPPQCSYPHLAVATHSLDCSSIQVGCSSIQVGCSSILLAVEAIIWLFKHSFGCSNISLSCSTIEFGCAGGCPL